MDVFIEFIEVAIHCILYNRNIYPQGVFEKRSKYNIPVQMCLHPEVNSYISSIMDSLKVLLSKGKVHKVSVVILQEDVFTPVERFVFEVSDCNDKWMEFDPHLFKSEQALRGFLLKLNVSDGLLKSPLKDLTWTVHIHTQESTLLAAEEQFIQQDFPWAEADEKETTLKNAKLIPLKNMTAHIFNMHLYVEESIS